ncbi:hypothetical protein G7K_0184-t1 [Saitoella complicata NRRL Y-17804]|uniref:Uncharacterized protein n=1 Tax=Saitoella complicata (strain BCRC 22490 / CBS 7301 / JCM 7358 / NBRC 10748 / NRRL Y-17804) TaxID=698492 RepID=A0A0E9N7Y9_SAICN|nr:hypothetical protein G7K_0184-t1 [Saitoella complicata NRRL Y-17804]
MRRDCRSSPEGRSPMAGFRYNALCFEGTLSTRLYRRLHQRNLEINLYYFESRRKLVSQEKHRRPFLTSQFHLWYIVYASQYHPAF